MKSLFIVRGFVGGTITCLALFWSACGSVSSIQPAAPGVSKASTFAKYTRVTVLDFTDQTRAPSGAEKAEKHRYAVATAGRLFADKVADALRTSGRFSEVSRGPVDGEALVIRGSIERYVEGNAAARMLVGMGAGSSYFDVDVLFEDNETKTEVGSLVVDRNSWVLGGGLAAGQSVESFMNDAAKKIAKELSGLEVAAR